MNISSYVHITTKMELLQGINANLGAEKINKASSGLSGKRQGSVIVSGCGPYISETD